MKRTRKTVAILMVLLMMLTACGQNGTDSASGYQKIDEITLVIGDQEIVLPANFEEINALNHLTVVEKFKNDPGLELDPHDPDQEMTRNQGVKVWYEYDGDERALAITFTNPSQSTTVKLKDCIANEYEVQNENIYLAGTTINTSAKSFDNFYSKDIEQDKSYLTSMGWHAFPAKYYETEEKSTTINGVEIRDIILTAKTPMSIIGIQSKKEKEEAMDSISTIELYYGLVDLD